MSSPATKLMFLLWDDGAGPGEHGLGEHGLGEHGLGEHGLGEHGLREPGLRERLAAVGVRRLQLNLDDEHVTDALRLQTFDQPVRAVVSVWTDGEPTEVAGVLGSPGTRVVGWRVEEHRPLEPPEHPDGSRADALANVAILRRPDELPHEEWLRTWLEEHTPVAIETQATFGYLQNVVLDPVTPDAPRVDAIVEELFPPAATTDMHAFYGSGGDDEELSRRITRLMESVARIGADRDLDLVPTSRYCYDL